MSQNLDLRHVTSNPALVSPSRDHRRTSQHLRTIDPTRMGLSSPNSIPSSPTSIHSSSSAIFERDIEPIIPPSPPGSHHTTHPPHPSNPHRIPRAKGTEALEQAVPSVLDSAAAVLSSLDPSELDFSDQVSVVAPALSASPSSFVLGATGGAGGVVHGSGSGFASPIGSFRSRSPSPLGSRITSPTSVLGLHNVSPPQQPHAVLPAASPPPLSSSPPRAALMRANDTAMTITPAVIDADQPPAIINEQEQDLRLPESTLSPSTSSQLSPTSISTSSASASATSPTATSPSPSLSPSSHPPSPLHLPKKRLSFMSYADLLSSTPSSMQPLANLTVGASSAEPPPHIPGVSGLNIVSALYAQGVDVGGQPVPPPDLGVGGGKGSATPSLRSISLGLSLPLNALGVPLPANATTPGSSPPPTQVLLGPQGGVTHPHKRDSIAMLDNLGGEWEREGLGRGMEERLEMVDFGEGVGGGGAGAGAAGGVSAVGAVEGGGKVEQTTAAETKTETAAGSLSVVVEAGKA